MKVAVKNHKAVATVLCTCKHAQQDVIYGIQKRLANLCGKDGDSKSTTKKVRCTVCSREHYVNEGQMR